MGQMTSHLWLDVDEFDDWLEDEGADPDNDENPFDQEDDDYRDNEDDWDPDEYPERDLLGC